MNKLQALLKANLALAKLIDHEANGVVSIDRQDTVKQITDILNEVFEIKVSEDYVLAEKLLLTPSFSDELKKAGIVFASQLKDGIHISKLRHNAYVCIKQLMDKYEETLK